MVLKILFVRKVAAFLAFALLLFPPTAFPQEVPESVQRLYAEARSEEQADHLDLAVQKYLEIIAISPSLAAAQNNLGRLYFQQGEYDKAIQSLEKASRLDPHIAAPHSLLGFSYFQTGNFEGSRRELELAQKLDPHNAQVKLFLARSLVELGDSKGALKLLEPLQHEDPHNTEVLYTLGFVYSALAETTFRQIKSTDPNSYLLDLLLGKAAEAKLAYVDAALHYKNAVEKAPDNWELYYRYGHALYAASQLPDALTAFRHALSLNPFASGPAWEAARILVAENPQEAYDLVTRAIGEKPDMLDMSEALVIRGRALLSLNQPKEAVEDLKKACALDANDNTCHFHLAHAYRQMGATEEAKREYTIYEGMQNESHERSERQMQKHLVPADHSSAEEPSRQHK